MAFEFTGIILTGEILKIIKESANSTSYFSFLFHYFNLSNQNFVREAYN